MTEPTGPALPAQSAFRPGPAILGFVLGLGGHVLAFVVAFLAARLATPSPGGGFEDVAAAVSTFFGIELLLALVCLIGGVLLLVRGRRDLGTGLLLGWLVGAVASWIFVQGQSMD
jgi:hypothetical protein